MRVRVKICGVTTPGDAAEAARQGADAVGLVFAAGSPRELTVERAAAVAGALPPFVAKVAVFRDAPADLIEAVLGDVPVDLLQFHGSESAADCARWNRPWLKAVPMTGETAPADYMARYAGAAGYLLDAFSAAEPGGRGVRFDWERWPLHSRAPLILAGGLTPDNVAEALRRTRPYAVDVSSGVESAPGVKEPALMQRFISEVWRAAGESD